MMMSAVMSAAVMLSATLGMATALRVATGAAQTRVRAVKPIVARTITDAAMDAGARAVCAGPPVSVRRAAAYKRKERDKHQ